jgi:hypothetical protein
MKMIYPQSHNLSKLPLYFCLPFGGRQETAETQSPSAPSTAHAGLNRKHPGGWRKITPTLRKEEEGGADNVVEDIRKKTEGTTRK